MRCCATLLEGRQGQGISSGMAWTIGEAGPEDVAAIAAVHQASRSTAMPWLKVPHTDAETRRWISSTLLPGFHIRVADDCGVIVGYTALGDSFLEALYVAPAVQGQGLGSQLLDGAKSGNAARLRLYTFQLNTRARQFYEARGFHAVSFGDGRGNDEGEPDVLYEWCRPHSGSTA